MNIIKTKYYTSDNVLEMKENLSNGNIITISDIDDVSKINTRDANLIYNMTKDLDIYKSYENAICIVNDYYNGNLYDWFINDFVEEYNDINKTNLNRNQIFKIIKNYKYLDYF